MKSPWLLLDCNYVCRRSFHGLGDRLTQGDIRIGVLFGFLRDLVIIEDQFDTDRVVFCFDYGRGLRHKHCPSYKAKRQLDYDAMPPEEKAIMDEYHTQVTRLREEYLPELGFNNVYKQEGYEADDLIAQLAATLPVTDDVVIVSSDKDMLQCIRRNVSVFSPHTQALSTWGSFVNTWGIEPDQWADVKALAGCVSDGVPGIKGVGELTAVRYLRGALKPASAAMLKINSPHGQGVWRRNLPIVRLPYPGTMEMTPQADDVTKERWQALVDRLGFKSLRNEAPISNRAARKRLNGKVREGFGL